MSNKFNLDRVAANVEKLKTELPRLLMNQAQTFFANTFQSQAWDGQAWKVPNRRMPGTKEYKYPMNKGLSRRTKPTLVSSGILRRAVSMSARGYQPGGRMILTVDLPYAARHNEGLDGMPKRPFMGDSPLLRDKQKELINQQIAKVWEV